MDIEGAIIIVTGAGGGVGRALATGLAGRGAKLVCVGRRESPLNETVRAIEHAGGEALAVPADVTDEAQVDAMVAATLDRFGRVDVLFNNAGSFRAIGAVWEVDPAAWWQDVTVNLLGSMLCARAVLGPMMQRDEGIIIHMRGGNRIPGGTGYSCSKVAIERLVELQAAELEQVGSKVMVVGMGPGFVHTDMTQLQADTPEGQFWLPRMGEKIRSGAHRPATDCVHATARLLEIARPELSGQCFGVDTDFEALAP